ncbi:putative rhamnogalacturonase [Ceratocystis platani]|uniref:rhamnogalacturonan endolyase n=1 Tax=Ceratocystis fimbriata f. sp. platani TaxID=88771 RepID=A0A0F8CP30_CERFI|nr:putative rhamnogalacturonase [Ceratocystis platani]
MKASMILQAFGATTLFASTASAAFGFTKSGSNYVVDAGSQDTFAITVAGNNCDVKSIKYRGTELQSPSRGTHIGSGLGSATVTAETVKGSKANYVKVTCTTDTLIHYIIVKEGEANMYMGTHITAVPSIGEMRYIARLNAKVLPKEYPFGDASDTSGNTQTIEGSDVFLVNGQTRSKFYSSERYMDTDSYCAYGEGSDAMHVCFVPLQMETCLGGPFFRDINSNKADSSTINLSFYMNSGHLPTEKARLGLNGPYVLSFTNTNIPKKTDFDASFFGELDIKGFVPDSGRGQVSGKATGVAAPFQPVVHWFNDAAQYWAKPGSDGTFVSPAMKPGDYTMVLYQTEYKVATSQVTVTAGKTASKSIASTYKAPETSLFKIGEFDGQPFELLNGDKFLRMHPSDKRMGAWDAPEFMVGTSKASDFPMAIFKTVNTPTISFNLKSDPGAATLRISTTVSSNGGRPQAVVNNWSAAAPGAPVKIDSRGVTRGAYRGFGEQYDIAIPAGKLVAGSNKISISALSGSTSDAPFLNPSFVVDAIELFVCQPPAAAKRARNADPNTNQRMVPSHRAMRY